MNHKSLIILFISILTINTNANYYGRFISGGFFSKEVFRASQNDRYNDVAILSERLFVNFDKIYETSNEFTVDIRDKENFFDKLNSERLRLTAKNRLQLHQLNLHKMGTEEGATYSFGRFSVAEAGGVFVDGMDYGFRSTMFGLSSKLSLFAGLNPAPIDESDVRFDPNAKVYGAYLNLEKNGKDWEDYLYSSSAIIKQDYKTETDRLYFFNNTQTQSNSGSNFSSLLYFDILPKINIQNLWTSFTSLMPNKYRFRTSISTIDTIHYIRTQDIRETLPSSRYNQAAISLRSPSGYDATIYESKITAGVRAVDKKKLIEIKFGSQFPKIFHDEYSGTLHLGLRKNFVSNDAFGGFGLLHSNKFREISLNQDIALERRTGLGLNYVSTTEGSYTKFFERNLFGIISAQNIWDKNVSIFSILFKISYRFGEGGQAPIRDGAPPMGQL